MVAGGWGAAVGVDFGTFPGAHDSPQNDLQTVPRGVGVVWGGSEIGYHRGVCGSNACGVELPELLGVVAFGCDQDDRVVGH
jgi:hypothetical protein